MDPNGMIKEFPELPELTFDEDSHIYCLDGIQIPSVSRVMEPLKDSTYGGISERTLRKAAEKGSSVHDSIENFIKFQIQDVNPEHRSYFKAFMEWWEENQPIVVGSEIRIYHKVLRYGGTLDLLCYLQDKATQELKLTLIDFKTTYALQDMTCGVQLEAYERALASHGVQVQEKMILHLKRDGKHKEKRYPANDSVRWRVFGSLKCVYDYTESYKK